MKNNKKVPVMPKRKIALMKMLSNYPEATRARILLGLMKAGGRKLQEETLNATFYSGR